MPMRPRPASPRATGAETVRLDARHRERLARFFREAWAAPPPVPDPAAPAFGLLLDDRLVGYIGTLPVRFWDGTRAHPAHWMKGFMVLPEYRNGTVGFLVLQHAVTQLGLAGSLSVAPAARRLFGAVGFKELGRLSNQIALLRPGRVFTTLDPRALGWPLPRLVTSALRLAQRLGLAAVAGALVAALLAIWRFGARLDTRLLHPGDGPPDPSEIDGLWRRLRSSLPFGVVRDGDHFARYGPGYRFVTVRRGATLEGVAVVRAPSAEGDPRLRGLRVAVIADLLAGSADLRAQRALLRAAERVAREFGADALLCSASYRPLRRLLARQGYLPFPPTVALLLRGAPGGVVPQFDAWWLLRGDGHADEAF